MSSESSEDDIDLLHPRNANSIAKVVMTDKTDNVFIFISLSFID